MSGAKGASHKVVGVIAVVKKEIYVVKSRKEVGQKLSVLCIRINMKPFPGLPS